MTRKIWFLQSPSGKHYVIENLKSFINSRPDMFPNEATAYVQFKRIASTMRGGNESAHTLLSYKGWRLDRPPEYLRDADDISAQNPNVIESEIIETSRSAIGAKIREKRKQCGLTQRNLAELIGTHLVTVSAWELGKQIPSIENAHKLANAIGCDVCDIIIEPYSEIGKNDYVQRNILIRESDFLRLKRLAYDSKSSIGDMIVKLIDVYESASTKPEQ